METLYIVDAVNVLFRSYYAIGKMTSPSGSPTGALYGFIRTLLKLIREKSPQHLVAVFDGANNKKKRSEIYPEYKSHREKMPEDLFSQLEKALLFCQLAGIPYLQIPEVEADDAMASIARLAAEGNMAVFICTSDKDLCQLVNERIHVLHIHKEGLDIDASKVEELYGVKPEQITDLLALMGDASDNIPGVEGFGAKTAASLLQEFGSLDYLLAHPECIKSAKKKEALLHGKELALLSKKLATLDCSVAIPQDLFFYSLKSPDVENLRKFYQEHHFVSLLKELGAENPVNASFEYTILEEEGAISSLVSTLENGTHLVLDTETTSLNIMEATLVGIGLGQNDKKLWYIPCNGKLLKKRVLELLSPLFAKKTICWVGHNIKYDLHVLANEGIFLFPHFFDTMIASYLAAPENPRHGLDELTLEKFGRTKISIESLIGKGKNQINMAEVPLEKIAPYCCEDIKETYALYELYVKTLEKEQLTSVMYTLEMPLIAILFHMERSGIAVDMQKIEEIGDSLKKSSLLLEKEVFALAGKSFNINSPKQLSQVLFEDLKVPAQKKTTSGYSTSADVLESLKETFPIVEKILRYRQFEKLRSTYTDVLFEEASKTNGVIHCTFNQSVAATGRLSCQNPNLQNIPVRTEEGKMIRSAFIPSKKNFLFLSADYSQIELRLLAHFSQDPALLHAFATKTDVHAHTASLVFGVPLQEVSDVMRYKAKAVNFGIIYGQGAYGLSQQIGVSQKEAAQFIETYFARYKNVKDFLESSKAFARTHGYAITLMGRKRPIPDISSQNGMIRSAAERLAINTPLQGTAADLIKGAMISVDKALQKHKHLGRVLLQIHDELILEGEERTIQELGSLVKQEMESVFSLKVPLVVDISVGKNWGEC